MDPADMLLLRELERGLPLVPEPYDEVGRRLGMSGDEVLERIRALKSAGLIRRFRARIDQRKIGITANALVAWKPPAGDSRDVGSLLASFPQVTHCYERRAVPGRWEYTHYTVHHGHSREEVMDQVRNVAESTGCRDYLVLFSTREYKRVPNVRITEIGGTPE